MKRLHHQRTNSSRDRFNRRLAIECLEQRQLLALGSLLQTLSDPGTLPQEMVQFGASVAFDGPYTVVGAPVAAWSGHTDAGLACVLNTNTGALVATLKSPTPATDDEFGSSVAISGSTVVVGAPGRPGYTDQPGSAFVFDAASGKLLQTLNNSAPAVGDEFGCSVAISGSTIVVGASRTSTGCA